jgi:putative PIN family toxin of toxin-antitoxin system
MRVVIDTNVLVSGIINPHGPPGRIVDSIVSLALTPLYDDRILSEYRDVLLRPVFGFRRNDVSVLLDFIEFSGEYITTGPVNLVLPDPDDLPFVEVAMAGSADALVTGNTKHFIPARRHGVSILTPAALLNLM